MMGTCEFTALIYTVAEIPSQLGMMMSMKMRSNRSGSLLILLDASSPSLYGHCQMHFI